jgi:hypothetical protein
VKSDYTIDRVTKSDAAELLLRFHYLKDFSKGFKSGYNYGLYKSNDFSPLNIGGIQGVCIFTGLPVPEIAKGAFGLERNEQQGLFELSRLCIHPDTQQREYNITSWFVSKAIKRLRKETEVKAIISYADHSRGSVKGCDGEWKDRSRKHRYVMVFDKNLDLLW